MMRFAVLACLLSGTAHAAAVPVGPPAAPILYGLTPEEKAQVLESASRRPDADNPALLPALPTDRRPHGEVGVMIGTGGARGIYGVVGVQVGQTGSAVLSFSDSQLPAYGYGRGSRFYGGGPFGAASQQSFGFGFRQPGW